MKHIIMLPVRLDLFDGGGSGGEGGNAAPGADNAAAAGSGQDGGRVVYGKQPAPQDGQGAGEQNPQHQATSDTLEARQQKWRELSAEYKDLYDQDVQRVTARSAREAAALRDQAARAQPVLDLLMDRYKIGDGDLGKLLQAVEDDSAYWSEAAEEAGMSVEQYKQFQRLQRQNQELVRAMQQRKEQEFVQAQLTQWNNQAQQLKAVYPSFDLNREMQNRDFLSMLRSGVPVRQAFEVIHMDEIKAAAAAVQAKATEQAVTANIKAKGARPQENGAGASSGFTVKDDVSRLSRKDRAEIAKRAARGEVITF